MYNVPLHELSRELDIPQSELVRNFFPLSAFEQESESSDFLMGCLVNKQSKLVSKKNLLDLITQGQCIEMSLEWANEVHRAVANYYSSVTLRSKNHSDTRPNFVLRESSKWWVVGTKQEGYGWHFT